MDGAGCEFRGERRLRVDGDGIEREKEESGHGKARERQRAEGGSILGEIGLGLVFFPGPEQLLDRTGWIGQRSSTGQQAARAG